MKPEEKLFRKISKKDRIALLDFVGDLIDKNRRENLDIKKLKGSDFFRARKGNFRVIFHFDSSGEVVVDSIKLRSKNTYK